MIEHIWSVVCNGSSIDQDTNTISIYNVLEQLKVFSDTPDSVSLPIHLEIFSLWTRENEKVAARGKMRMFFCDPGDNCKKKAELDIDLKEAVFFRSRIRVDGLDLNGAGRYKFVVELQQEGEKSWQKVASLPILVSIQPIASYEIKNQEENIQIK
jgi:hypothetical protein